MFSQSRQFKRYQRRFGACALLAMSLSSPVWADGISIGIGVPLPPIVIEPLAGDFSLEDGFGDQGLVVEQTILPVSFRAVVVMPDGSVLAAGSRGEPNIGPGEYGYFAEDDFFYIPRPYVARYSPDGEESNFSWGDHFFRLPLPYGEVTAAALTPQGALIVAGSIQEPGEDGAGFIARRTEAGEPDASFGELGLVVDRFDFRQVFISALVVRPDGKILVAGCAETLEAEIRAMAIQLLENGAPDSDFGVNGVALLDTGADACSEAIVVQPDHRLLIAGTVQGVSPNQGFMARLRADGLLDDSFNETGQRYLTAENDLSLHDLSLHPDGRIFAAGDVVTMDGQAALLVALMADGSVDSSVAGESDYLSMPSQATGGHKVARKVLLQPDGDVLIVGDQTEGEGSDPAIFVTRLFGEADDDVYYFVSSDPEDQAYRLSLPDAFILPDATLMLSATGYLYDSPQGMVMKIRLRDVDGDGVTEAWGLQPDATSLPAAVNVTEGVVTSGVMTISGLEDGVFSPFAVTGGEYSLNSVSDFSSGYGWLKNGDEVMLRFDSSQQPEGIELIIGGLNSDGSPAAMVTEGFVQRLTVSESAGQSASAGAGGWWWLFPALLGMRARWRIS